MPDTPPPRARPVLVFDGDCRFCRLWIERWHEATGEAVEYLPQQDPECARRFPQLEPAALRDAVHLVDPDGHVTRGAQAVLLTLARAPHLLRPTSWLLRRPGIMAVLEGAYGIVARHRVAFSFLTRLLWGHTVRRPTWFIARELLLAGLAAIHGVAFLSLWVQIDGLLGSRGILPAAEFLQRAASHFDQAGLGLDRYRVLPTLAWFGAGDTALQFCCGLGLALSVLAFLGLARAPAFLGLWALYLSLSVVGQDFLSFQWDALLLETTLVAVFLAPWRLRRADARAAPPSGVARLLVVWLLFRLMFQSGLVKLLSGDISWQNLTALEFHYWTQPLPGPLAWHVHHLPVWFNRAACAALFVVELALPWLVWAPRRPRLMAFTGFTLLQLAILATGNYTFFNLLALVLGFSLVDDASWRKGLAALRRDTGPAQPPIAPAPSSRPARFVPLIRRSLLAALVLVALLAGSAPLIRTVLPTLAAPGLALQHWLAPLRSFNSYGLFAVMTVQRPEIIVEGSSDGARWEAYEFRHKPGDPRRSPAQVAPHQPRLDWQMWFAALSDVRRSPWFLRFTNRLLEGSPPVLALLRHNPFPETPPRFVRARLVHYRFSSPAERRQTGAWWIREDRGLYCPPLALPASAAPPNPGP